jgi:O-antigen ligase
MALLTAMLLGAWAISAALGRQALVWRAALVVPLIATLLVIGWVLMTVVAGVGEPHPIWQIASDARGAPLAGRIALSADAALVGLMRLLAYAGIFWITLQYCRDAARAEQLLAWISWAGLVLAVYGLANYFAGNPYLLWYQRFAGQADVTSTFVNRNSYATFAGLGMLASLAVGTGAFRHAWRLSDRSQKMVSRTIECLAGRPIIYFVIMIAIGMAWLQTHSRMGAAAVLLGLAVMLLLMMVARVVRRQWILLLVAILIVGFLFQVSGNITLARWGATNEIDRIPIFSVVVDQIASAPYTGSGYGSFGQAFLMYRDQRLSAPFFYQQAHNTYLELAAELGIPAAALLIFAVLWCFLLCLIGVFRRQRAQIYPIVAASATIVVGVHALMDFSLQIPAVAAVYSALLAMGVAQSWSKEPRR